LVVFGGIYLAIDPRLYRDGLLKLVPPAIQPNVHATLDDAGHALKRWLRGQVLAMLLVGVFTGLGLWLVGVPSAFALGFIAGIAEFVPIVGPILAAIPVRAAPSSSSTPP
jgi:predicted PurR-regulated permease PerM